MVVWGLNMLPRTVILKEVASKIYHFEFPSQYLMCVSLIRIQEHYESPKFRNKVFDLEEYMDYYADTGGTHNFTYFQDILGFNIPSYAIESFYNGDFDPLTRKEQKILQVLEKMERPYYIIATTKKSISHKDDFIHETAHGLFTVNEEYRKAVKKILKGVNLSKIEEWLKERGYNKSVYLDECHAILMESANNFSRCGVKASEFKSVRRQLRKNYDDYFIPINKVVDKFRMP